MSSTTIAKLVFLVLGIIAWLYLIHAFFYDPVNAGRPINGAVGMSIVIGGFFVGIPLAMITLNDRDEWPTGIICFSIIVCLVMGMIIAQ